MNSRADELKSRLNNPRTGFRLRHAVGPARAVVDFGVGVDAETPKMVAARLAGVTGEETG
jgi:hypothetical protein